MKRLMRLYDLLLQEYGYQKWWPADSQYEIIVGALLTQNTNWKNVEKAIINLKNENMLDPRVILEAQNSKLETLIRPSGFYRQKTERLKLLTEKYLEIKDKTLDVKQMRAELLKVKGVGKETADSIILYGFGMPIFVIDSYTKRFCSYYELFQGKEYDEYREFFEKNLSKDVGLYKEYHALIVEWAKRKKENKKLIEMVGSNPMFSNLF